MTDRRSLLAIVAAVAVVAAGVGWVAGQRIKSPADVAAEAEPPEPSLITVPVEQRQLSSNVVIRGQVEFSESSDISVSGSADAVAIITRLPLAPGDDLEEGAVAVEVAGRPVFVLEGELPVFRSLTPTLVGPDVRQLEEALVRLGLDPGSVDGVFDTSTESAISELYRAAGYTADEPTAEDTERIDSARSRLRDAQNQLTEIEKQVGSSSLPESTRLELDRAVTNAERALTVAVEDRTTALATAAAEVENAKAAVLVATDAADLAAQRLAGAQGGTHPDTGVAPTSAELTELTLAETTAAAALDDALAAQTEAIAAEPGVEREQDGIVSDAETDLEIAKATRSETIQGANGSGGGDQIRSAREIVTEEQKTLFRLEAEIGVTFPAAELVFLPSLPSAVQAVRVDIGDVPQGPVMTVTGSGVRIESTVSAADRSLLTEGAEAIMEDAALGLSIPAVVSFVADDPGGQDVAADRYIVRLEPVGELPEDAINQNLRVTIPFASTEGEVLAVPLAALSSGADGSVRVEVERPDGTVETIVVSTGLNARALGLVEIKPVDGDLKAGDRVVVGRNTAPSAGGTDANRDDANSTDANSDSSAEPGGEDEGEDGG